MVKLPKYIQEIIFTKLQAVPAPYYYELRGTSGGAVGVAESAYAALEKLKAWAERNDAEVNVIRDGFKNIGKGTKLRNVHILVEITDPVSKHIDDFIRSTRKEIYSPARDRMEWLRYQERGIDNTTKPVV